MAMAMVYEPILVRPNHERAPVVEGSTDADYREKSTMTENEALWREAKGDSSLHALAV